MAQSLFGYLVHKFGSNQAENLATEALAFILNNSPVARRAFRQLLTPTGVPLPEEIHYTTQVAGDDGSIPDLVGTSTQNAQVIICEAKFWAGLTDNQPTTYLNRLRASGNGVLLFLAPSLREPTLWPELLRRCQKSHPNPLKDPSGLLIVHLDDKIAMALSSWRSTLTAIRHALETEGDMDMVANVRQLEGLCERMDTQAFLPLHSAELAGVIGARLLQYNALIDAATQFLVQNKTASTEGLRATSTFTGYGRYMTVGQFGLSLQVNAKWWSTLRETPIWLDIKDSTDRSDWVYSPEAEQRLGKFKLEKPTRLFRERDAILVPIFLPVSVERDEVLDFIRSQLNEIIKALTAEV